MIELTKAFRRNDMLFSVTISVDQKAAGIVTEIDQKIVEGHLECHISKISENKEDAAQDLHDYLKRELFTRLIDHRIVKDFVIAVTKTVQMAMEKMDHKGFIYLFDFYV